MRVVHGTDALGPGDFRAPVVTLGVFDGVHRGHRRVLARARELAHGISGEVVVVTFHQHPRAVTVGVAPPLITSLDHRLVLLEREGVDATVVLHFDRLEIDTAIGRHSTCQRRRARTAAVAAVRRRRLRDSCSGPRRR